MEYGSGGRGLSRRESGLGITIPRSSPMPMPMQGMPCRGSLSSSPQTAFSLRSIGMSHSPVQYQQQHQQQYLQPGMNSVPRNYGGRILASSPISSPISPATEMALSIGRDGQRSSPQGIRGHTRTGSSTSMLHSTSLARSQQSTSGFLSATPTTPSGIPSSLGLQQSFPAQSPLQHQASIDHQRQQQQRHQRQRSVGAATIMGSLGRNGGYLSQQPASLTTSDFMGAASLLVSNTGRDTSPPAYVE